jgi:type I restriction-modification system DNA methylase subunit
VLCSLGGEKYHFPSCSYSCGYRKLFEQYASILKEKYPELHIEGQNFNPSGYAMIVAKTIVIELCLFLELVIQVDLHV